MIKILNEDTIQKIAAGEVIERPASIIKELVENSIDAKADNIIVEIKNGGKSYIKVSDNGIGIKSDEIETAFLRHATSKIKNFDDLYNIFSMGFRGEALASIIAVSKLIIKSKTDNEDFGTQLIYDNNKLLNRISIGMNRGTIIEVFDLFNYIPVRKKFLNSDISETNKITHLMYSFSIGNPNISFTYIKDNKEVFKTLKNKNSKINFEILFGEEFIRNSIELNFKSKNYEVYAIISNNKYYKGNRSMQYIYVNGRYIVNEKITNAIESCYNNFIPNARFPLFKIDIKVDPKHIDINIHPNKQKIKFNFRDELLNIIKNNITEALYLNDKHKIVNINDEDNKTINFHKLNKGDGYKKILEIYKESNSLTKNVDNTLNDYVNDKFDNKFTFSDISNENEQGYTLNINDNKNDYLEKDENSQISIKLEDIEFNTVLFNKFLVFNEINNNSILIVNIDYANQRIIYDKLKVSNEKLTQNLIEPIVIKLNKKDIEKFEHNIDNIKNLGYEVELFSETSIIIRSIPYYMGTPSTEKDFINILDTSKNFDDKIQESFIRKAVSLAVYKNKNISEIEANLIYKDLLNTSNPYTSPSGKTILYEIDYDTFLRFLNK